MSQPFKLNRLQLVDTLLDQARNRLAGIEDDLQQDTALRAAQADYQQALSAQQEASRQLRQAEHNVQDQQHKIELNQAALYGGTIKNPKELTDLHQENDALKRFLSVLEDRQLEIMISLEQAEAALVAAQRTLDEVQAQYNRTHASLKVERETLQNDVARLGKERAATATDLPADDLEVYEKLRQKRGGVAVAQVKDDTCAACGASLASSLAQASRSATTLAYCTSCGRILYGG
jgi:predicted  nucleic acid-binding Zn-ribbon protein